MEKIYEKTRYANIYRHSKNGNYVIRHNNTTISKINNQKITTKSRNDFCILKRRNAKI